MSMLSFSFSIMELYNKGKMHPVYGMNGFSYESITKDVLNRPGWFYIGNTESSVQVERLFDTTNRDKVVEGEKNYIDEMRVHQPSETPTANMRDGESYFTIITLVDEPMSTHFAPCEYYFLIMALQYGLNVKLEHKFVGTDGQRHYLFSVYTP